MIKKPEKYDDIQINEDYTPISLGGHKGIIMGVEEYTSPLTNNTSLKVSVDTDKDDTQPGYFAEQYKNDTRPDKKWSNAAIKYVSLGEEENQVKMLKGFITAVENSNKNFTFDWNKEVSQLKGKKIGLVFGLEEYENQQGETKTVTKLNQFRSLDKVDNVKIPRVKLLDGTTMDYDEYHDMTHETHDPVKKAVDVFGSDVVEIDPDLLPF